jgi:hypothetical protein
MADDTDTIDPDSHLNQPEAYSDAEFERQRQKDAADAEARRRAAIEKGNPAPKEFDPYAATGAVKPTPAAAAPAAEGGFDPRTYGSKNPPESALDPSDPDYWLVDPNFGGTSPWTRYPAQAARGVLRGAVYDPAYGLGQLARMGVQAMRPDFKETRPKDELKDRWGSAVRAMRAREHQSEPGWLTRLADYTEGEFGPKSKAAKVYGAESAGPVEATTRFAGGLALPFGKAKWAAEGASGLGKLAATGAGYGLAQPTEHGTFREKAAQAGAGAAGSAILGKVAQRFAPKAVEKITEAEAKSGISNINAKISAQEGQAADRDVIVPHLKGLANRIGVTIEGNDAAKQKLAAAMTVINNHFAKSPKLGGTPFSNLINDLDIISGDLRQQGGKLSPEMRTVAEGIEKMTAALENHVAQKAPQADKAAQSSARQRLRDFIEGTGREAEKAEGPLGTSVADLAKAAVFHKWHAASMLPGAGRGLGRLAGSERFRAIAPRLGQAAAVRATQKGEADSDSQN